jgi:hypothetical protein
MLKYTVTYDIVTEESAIDGDFEESGFIEEDGLGSLKDIISECQDRGASMGMSVSSPTAVSLYSEGQIEDYSTDETITYAVHIKFDGLTKSSVNRVIRALKKHV